MNVNGNLYWLCSESYDLCTREEGAYYRYDIYFNKDDFFLYFLLTPLSEEYYVVDDVFNKLVCYYLGKIGKDYNYLLLRELLYVLLSKCLEKTVEFESGEVSPKTLDIGVIHPCKLLINDDVFYALRVYIPPTDVLKGADSVQNGVSSKKSKYNLDSLMDVCNILHWVSCMKNLGCEVNKIEKSLCCELDKITAIVDNYDTLIVQLKQMLFKKVKPRCKEEIFKYYLRLVKGIDNFNYCLDTAKWVDNEGLSYLSNGIVQRNCISYEKVKVGALSFDKGDLTQVPVEFSLTYGVSSLVVKSDKVGLMKLKRLAVKLVYEKLDKSKQAEKFGYSGKRDILTVKSVRKIETTLIVFVGLRDDILSLKDKMEEEATEKYKDEHGIV